MDTEMMQGHSKLTLDRDHRVTNTLYGRAIIRAIEGLHDHQCRSNVDLIRRHTQTILEGHSWNDKVFLKTLKAIVRDGEVEQSALIYAELSPEYKKKRADSITHLLEERLVQAPEFPCCSGGTTNNSVLFQGHLPTLHSVKEPPKRKSEHEKWKIMPKKLYDKTM